MTDKEHPHGPGCGCPEMLLEIDRTFTEIVRRNQQKGNYSLSPEEAVMVAHYFMRTSMEFLNLLHGGGQNPGLLMSGNALLAHCMTEMMKEKSGSPESPGMTRH